MDKYIKARPQFIGAFCGLLIGFVCGATCLGAPSWVLLSTGTSNGKLPSFDVLINEMSVYGPIGSVPGVLIGFFCGLFAKLRAKGCANKIESHVVNDTKL